MQNFEAQAKDSIHGIKLHNDKMTIFSNISPHIRDVTLYIKTKVLRFKNKDFYYYYLRISQHAITKIICFILQSKN